MIQEPVAQTGVLHLVTQAGPVVQIVLALLLSASIYTWGVIIGKWKSIRIAKKENDEFLAIFWGSSTFEDIMEKSDRLSKSPIAMSFKAGYREFQRLSPEAAAKDSTAADISMENLQRALARSAQSEISILEKFLSSLATTASAAPFVGLFGTVWGIMNSFQNIGAAGSASLAVVAPGISEALIATAVGLAAAIPAVIGYNYFVNLIKKIATDLDCFSQDFLNIVRRNLRQESQKGN